MANGTASGTNGITLLPCAHCGGEARHYAPGPAEHHIECTNPKCYMVTHGWLTEAEAIEAWNTRAPEQATAATLGGEINGETSDGYHTFNELYHHRAVLFSVVVAANSNRAWKSKLHHDGTMYEGMFIVGVDTPQGQATYHYDVEPYWDMFWCKELERAPEWDGHTPDDAIERIGSLRDVVLKGPRGRR